MNRKTYRKAYGTTVLLLALAPVAPWILLFILGKVIACF